MPKLKSHSATKKRVKVTKGGKIHKGGKILLQKSAKNHLLINKSKKQKKKNHGGQATNLGNQKNIKKLLPYGK